MGHRRVALLLSLLAIVGFAAEAGAAGLEHPVSVSVTPLDPLKRGASVRFLVRASSRVGLDLAEARLTNADRAIVVGSNRITLGRLEPRKTKDATFQVVLPRSGERTRVKFKIVGEGPNGMLSRDAAFDVRP